MAKAKGRDGAGTIEKLPSGRYRWRVRVAYPDGTFSRPGGVVKTIKAAQAAINAALSEAEAGQRPVAQSLTVAQLVTEFMEAKRAAWSERTYLNNAALFRRHIVSQLGSLKAAGLQPKALRAYFERLTAAGLAPSSGQRQIHVLLSGAYKRAIGDGVLRENPAAYARPVQVRQAAKIKAFTPDEAASFFAACLEDRWALVLAFLAVTGLRIGEALALTWADFSEEPNVPGLYFVDVSKTRSEFEGKAYEGAPKTAKGKRRVWLSADAVSIVEDMRRRVVIEAQAHRQGVPAYIFPSVDGRPMRQDTARAVMRRTCERANVPKLSPHALRHTFASMNLAAGLPVGNVSAHLGHAQTSTTLNIYQTPYEAGRQKVVLNLSAAKEERPKTGRTKAR